MAAQVNNATEAQLRDATIAANNSTAPSSTITLTTNITLTDPYNLPVATKPLQIIAGPRINGNNALRRQGTAGTVTFDNSGAVPDVTTSGIQFISVGMPSPAMIWA